jgi:hypothetical protein
MEYDDDRRIHWMTFIGVLVGMVLIAVFLMGMLRTIDSNKVETELSRRTRIEACKSLEHEVTRTVCIGEWGR